MRACFAAPAIPDAETTSAITDVASAAHPTRPELLCLRFIGTSVAVTDGKTGCAAAAIAASWRRSRRRMPVRIEAPAAALSSTAPSTNGASGTSGPWSGWYAENACDCSGAASSSRFSSYTRATAPPGGIGRANAPAGGGGGVSTPLETASDAGGIPGMSGGSGTNTFGGEGVAFTGTALITGAAAGGGGVTGAGGGGGGGTKCGVIVIGGGGAGVGRRLRSVG